MLFIFIDKYCAFLIDNLEGRDYQAVPRRTAGYTKEDKF